MVFRLNKKLTAFLLFLLSVSCVFLLLFSGSKPSDAQVYAVADEISENILVPILMYHEVKPTKSGKDAITPYEFESDLKYLEQSGYTAINMSELIAYVNNEKDLPEKPIIISFDDGYYNNYVYTFPIIKKHNTKIVLSIIGKSTDDFTCDPAKNLDYTHLSWTQINEMIDSGLVEIQNHSYDMHKNTAARFGCAKNHNETSEHYEDALSKDLQKLQDEVRLFTGKVPNTFTYPYGKISDESLPIIQKLGFKATLSCTYGINIIERENSSLYGLKRICRVHGTGAKKSIEGAMKTLKYATRK